MRLVIAQKFRPFSHTPGTRCLIPLTTWEAEIYPAKIFFHNLAGGAAKEEILDVKGPVKGFTVMQDLERGRVEVFGRDQKGHFRYFLTPEKYPFLEKYDQHFAKKKLFLGISKKQDWDLIKRRKDMTEIFPFWHLLSQWIPTFPLPEIGTAALLKEKNLDLVFQTAFQGILSPRLKDENYLGIIPDLKVPKDFSPLGILHEGARQIEDLLFLQEGEVWHFLPSLPKEFHAGRFIHLQTREGDEIDFEWSKKQLKKVIIRPFLSRKIFLKPGRGLKSFRIRTNMRQKGKRDSQELFLETGKTYFLDRFMK